MTIENTLKERGNRYGAFINHAEIAQGIQSVFHKMPNWPTLDYDMRQALVVISDKIARIGNGDPFYSDNWHDIMGYAKLVDDRLKALEAEAQRQKNQTITVSNPLSSMDAESVKKVADTIKAQLSQFNKLAAGGIVPPNSYVVGEQGLDHARLARKQLDTMLRNMKQSS